MPQKWWFRGLERKEELTAGTGLSSSRSMHLLRNHAQGLCALLSILSLTLLPGCGDDGGDDGGGGGGGGVPLCEEGQPGVAIGSDGGKTRYPSIAHNVLGSYEIESIGYLMNDAGTSLQVFAEVRNTGATIGCLFLPDFFIDGYDLIGIVEASPYYGGISVTDACIPPGGTGVVLGVSNSVPSTILETASEIYIDMDPFSFGTYTPTSDAQVRDASVVESGTGFAIEGEIYVSSSLYNYGLNAYPRDGDGIIVDELLAFPGSLNTLPTGSTTPFLTEAIECEFSGYTTYGSWITNQTLSLARLSSSPGDDVRDEIAARHAEHDSLRD